jgi:hypothetical protein
MPVSGHVSREPGGVMRPREVFDACVKAPVQGQQASGPPERSTFAQKRAISFSVSGEPIARRQRASSRAFNSAAVFDCGPRFPMINGV